MLTEHQRFHVQDELDRTLPGGVAANRWDSTERGRIISECRLYLRGVNDWPIEGLPLSKIHDWIRRPITRPGLQAEARRAS